MVTFNQVAWVVAWFLIGFALGPHLCERRAGPPGPITGRRCVEWCEGFGQDVESFAHGQDCRCRPEPAADGRE